MIDAKQLLVDLTRQLKGLEADLRQRIAEQPDLDSSLRDEWKAALDAKRCAETFETWADQVITQAGVHWLLSCVFLRFIEDNQLVDRPWLAGTPESGRLALARDRHEAYFRAHPLESDRDYLLAAFREAGTLPGLRTFFDEAHNPVFRLGISGDAAMALRQFWQQVHTDTGRLIHDFFDSEWNTRFLGDLYERLSEATRKRYALLQTPEFVEEFILERTLKPAIQTFGIREVRMIDPTCGSGHFLLGGFARLVNEWYAREPGRNPSSIAQLALSAVAGVDLNPFAVAISRFRLLVAALRVAGVNRLANAPTFQIEVAIGDSLLHGTRFGMTSTQSLLGSEQFEGTGLSHAYATEDLKDVQKLLSRQYHAVVGNPPYIVVKDAALNAAYRAKYASCHMKYSLGCPFTERFFDLAVTGGNGPAGYVGVITTNSFMKRDFGVKLVKAVLPTLDLTHVIDTSRAHIPGHGTPTVILFGRHQRPVASTVRVVTGITADSKKPKDAAKGEVWLAIVENLDLSGAKNRFVEVSDFDRGTLSSHPWAFGAEEVNDLKALIENRSARRLRDAVSEIGFGCVISEEEAFFLSPRNAADANKEFFKPIVGGDAVRDWSIDQNIGHVLFPYSETVELLPEYEVAKALWTNRTTLAARKDFGNKTYREANRPWWEYHQISAARNRQPFLITVAFVATHNHFVLSPKGKVYGRTAPILVLRGDASEQAHFELLATLNSSLACFWLKRILMDRGGGGIGGGIATEPWERFYEHDGGKMLGLPLPADAATAIAAEINRTAVEMTTFEPVALLRRFSQSCGSEDIASIFRSGREEYERCLRCLIALQEELDWHSYASFGLLGTNPSAYLLSADHRDARIDLGQRAFEIVLARRKAAGEVETTWFERHGSRPITEVPTHWPVDYKFIVERRVALIEQDRYIDLLEAPEHKRRWNTTVWDDLEKAALRDWLLDRLEQPAFWPASVGTPPQLTSTAKLAERAQADADFVQVAARYAGHADFDAAQLVAELVASEAVPLLPVQRYNEEGLRKRAQWEATWTLQRREDAIDAQVVADNADEWRSEFAEIARTTFGSDTTDEARAWIEQKLTAEIKRHQEECKAAEVGPIPVPPKYKSSDFLRADFWRLRGGLDVPKERFVSFPGAERGADGSLVIAWAGWNHLQLATALAGYYGEMKDNEGWEPARLQPLLAGLLELVPWLEQWHNDIDPEFGQRMGTYYLGFVTEDARALGFTLDDLRAWKPAVVAARRGRRRAN